jgi:alpha/beta superfamily hydrolase
MHTRLVFHLARALHEAGFATLRFNFRGVGLSGGVYDGGAGERGDVRAALEHLSGRHPAGPLVVAGHSFGAWVGLQVGMSDSRVRQLVGVGIPIKTYDFGFLEGAGKDILFIQGDRDRFGAASEVEALAARVAGTAVILPGGEHLLEGHLGELRRVILERLPETGSGQST